MPDTKVTLRDIYDISARLEEKLDSRMNAIENRVNCIEDKLSSVTGRVTVFMSLVGALFVAFMGYFFDSIKKHFGSN